MKEKFPNKLNFSEAGYKNGSLCVRLKSKFTYLNTEVGDSTIVVPRGFVSDGASVPRCLWSILSPFGEYFRAAVVHDFLYSKHSQYSYSRKECDLIFRAAMRDLGVNKIKRNLIYYAVRIGGDSRFKLS